MALLEKHVYQMGPLLRLQWQVPGEPPPEAKARGSLWLERSLLEALRARLVPMSPPDPKLSQCWVWTGPVDGDGRATVYNQDKQWTVPRLLFTIEFGPLSERVVLYSACGVPRCCNPNHYLPVNRGPIRRPKTSFFTPQVAPRCRYGHALTPANTYVYQGKVMCRDCRAAAQRRYRAGGRGR